MYVHVQLYFYEIPQSIHTNCNLLNPRVTLPCSQVGEYPNEKRVDFPLIMTQGIRPLCPVSTYMLKMCIFDLLLGTHRLHLLAY